MDAKLASRYRDFPFLCSSYPGADLPVEDLRLAGDSDIADQGAGQDGGFGCEEVGLVRAVSSRSRLHGCPKSSARHPSGTGTQGGPRGRSDNTGRTPQLARLSRPVIRSLPGEFARSGCTPVCSRLAPSSAKPAEMHPVVPSSTANSRRREASIDWRAEFGKEQVGTTLCCLRGQ